MSSQAVFLDRDGVINLNHGYVHTREAFDFIDEIFDVARYAIDLSCSVLIGDKVSDIQAGHAAGVGTNLLFASQRPPELDGLHYHQIGTLREALPYLKNDSNQRSTQ